MVVKGVAVSRGRCEDSTIIGVIDKLMGYNTTNQIFDSWFGA